MDNIILETVWQDASIYELKITASSEYITVFQSCYVDSNILKEAKEKIHNYGNNYDRECYLEFGDKTGNCTPAFSLKIFPADIHGHVKIEVDMEIDDNDKREHRCCFYVMCELGQLERFGKSLMLLLSGVGATISLT